jgi:hypothetical protein
MYARVEKSKENKSRAVANSVAQKKSNVKQGFGFANNRPEVVTQKKLKKMVGKCKQTEGDNTNKTAIQGKFIGPLSPALLGLNTKIINVEGTWFDYLRLTLSGIPENILITDGDPAYQPSTNTLYLRKSWFDDLEAYKKKLLNPESESDLTADVAVSHIASIAHELSHVKDHLVDKKEITGDVKKVLDSELRAWNIEAVSAYQAGKKLGGMDGEKAALIESCRTITRSMLGNLTENSDNHVIARIKRYIGRELGGASDVVINGWSNTNDDWLWPKVKELQDNVNTNAPLDV